MLNKKKRLFKLLFFPISLLLCLSIFLINSFAQNGYELDNQGNIQSMNLFNGSLTDIRASNVSQSINYSTIIFSSISGNDPYWYGSFDCYEVGKTYTISIVSSEILQNWNFLGNNLNQNVSSTFTATQTTYEIGFEFAPNSYTNCTIYIMLNDGSTALDYFPYGYYVNSNIAFASNDFYNNVSKIVYSDEGLVYEELETENAYLYLNNSTMKFKELLSANGIYNVQQHQTQRQNLEINLINPINFSNYVFYFMFENAYNIIGGNPSDYYIAFSGRGYSSQIFYFNDLNYIDGVGYKLELNNNMYVDTIDFYWNNIETLQCWPLVMTSSEYNLGYQKGNSIGYSNGYNAGYRIGEDNGIDIGRLSGYQDGYNDGMETDLSTNGVRTLFNSILSFPVDMIKNVFNFDFMGVNVASVIMFIISIGIVAFVIKKFL